MGIVFSCDSHVIMHVTAQVTDGNQTIKNNASFVFRDKKYFLFKRKSDDK